MSTEAISFSDNLKGMFTKKSLPYLIGTVTCIAIGAVAMAVAYAELPLPLGVRIVTAGAGFTLAVMSSKVAKLFSSFIGTPSEKENEQKALIEALKKPHCSFRKRTKNFYLITWSSAPATVSRLAPLRPATLILPSVGR